MRKPANYECNHNSKLLEDLKLNHLAWEFNSVSDETFKRNRPQWKNYRIPVICPVPDNGSYTKPKTGANINGPFIYAVVDKEENLLYIGKTLEKTITKRWIRPDVQTGKYYWSHGTTGNPHSGNPKTVERIAEHIKNGKGNIRILFADNKTLFTAALNYLNECHIDNTPFLKLSEKEFNTEIEALLISEFRPQWNIRSPKVSAYFQNNVRFWGVTNNG